MSFNQPLFGELNSWGNYVGSHVGKGRNLHSKSWRTADIQTPKREFGSPLSKYGSVKDDCNAHLR